MRMPVVSYFVVMGLVLTAALMLVSSQVELQPLPFISSQIDGLEKPSAPKPEPPSYRITATNFAAPYKAPTEALAQANDEESKPEPAHTVKVTRSQQQENYKPRGSSWNSIGNYPIDKMMAIH
jgi:hypothetical protein